jgi:putative redox protein
MEIAKIRYTGGLRCEATHLRSGQTIITDAPLDNKGKGEAFSPSDLLCASLGTCMLTIAGIAAQTHGFDIDGTEITISKIMQSEPRKVGEIRVEVNFPAINYSEKEKAIIEKAIYTCPVALSLHEGLKQTVIFNYPATSTISPASIAL